MSEYKYREWILDSIDSLRSRKARPDLERICRMIRRRHGTEPERTCAELEKLIHEQTVLKVNYKGSISYRNAAKVQRRSRKNFSRRNTLEETSHSDLSNSGAADQDEADTSVAMDTDSNPEEEESGDGQDGPSPSQDAAVRCRPSHAVSAPCSPSDPRRSGLHSSSIHKTCERPNSLPSCSPPALTNWGSDSAVSPMERPHPKGADLKPAVFPCALNSIKKEVGSKMEDRSSSDQLVPDFTPQLDDAKGVPDGISQTFLLPSENCVFRKIKVSPTEAADVFLNGSKEHKKVSVKKEKTNQNLLLWTVADVASYFSAAGFPEQATAFRTQEIDGKSLLLMQRSDVLTGLSIRLGPALKIYERHVKVLQRSHFTECEDL